MRKADLLVKLKTFKQLLTDHERLWAGSLSSTLPDYPISNTEALEEQQRQLHKLLYVLDPCLSKYSHGRTMRHPATGVAWDIYRSAAGNDVALIKGPSIRNAILELEGIIAVVEQQSEETDVSGTRSITDKRIFISHGKETKALQKIERFVRALGLTPIIVRYEPSKGEAVDDLVEEKMTPCLCAIILATRDDRVEGYWQPRPNVIHEIGLAQEKLKGRLVYLKEEGCQFPSNVSPKVWENFTQDNMEDAFLKITKELRAFEII